MTLRFRRWHLGWAVLSSALLWMVPMGCSANNTASPGAPLIVSGEPWSDLAAAQVRRFAQMDVVYLGETHDSVADHAAQLAIIEAIYQENPNIAIALEMFQRPFQPVLDRYLAGKISEADLIAQTEYAQRWGFPWEFYAPIVRFAQAKQIPLLALNAPSEVVRQVSRSGLDSLTAEDFSYIPARGDIDTSNADYQAWIQDAFSGHGSHGSFDFENFFAAQVVWDETMAEVIATFKQNHPDTVVIVLAGSGHVVYGYGIPDRVARRLGDDLQQTRVLLNYSADRAANSSDAIADILWYNTPESPE